MKVAIVGSRNINNFTLNQMLAHIPAQTTELVSGGAVGIDSLAEQAARALGIPITVFTPDYSMFGKQAPLIRNRQIVNHADLVLAFWDNRSRGTAHTLNYCIETGKPFQIFTIS